jgi:hypothetical protein
MSDENQPSLEDLGLGEPVKVSKKISIAELQRQSEREIDDYRPVVAIKKERLVAMDIGALLLSIILPGAGHGLKGHWERGFAWFAGIVFLYVTSFVLTPIPAIIAHICCIAAATIIEMRD